MTMDITDEQKQRLLDPLSVAIDPVPSVDLDGDETPDVSHRGGDGRRGITIEMCNVIRCAAEDGKSYREIADLFGFLSSWETARLHAVGDCVHGSGEIPPIASNRGPGFNSTTITKYQCRRLRRRFERGDFETFTDAGEEFGVFRTTIAHHVKGECGHE